MYPSSELLWSSSPLRVGEGEKSWNSGSIIVHFVKYEKFVVKEAPLPDQPH